jgi:hypothetical protein
MATITSSAGECRFHGRRRLLQVGGLSYLGLGLAGLLRASGRPAPAARIKSCIVIFYYGGPSHLDTWDPKPTAPLEIRGEFRSVATKVPGVHICEHLPHCARIMDKLAVVRSLSPRKAAFQTLAWPNSLPDSGWKLWKRCVRLPLRACQRCIVIMSSDQRLVPCGRMLS